MQPVDLDDLFASLGLIVVAGLVAGRVVARRSALMAEVEAESAENRIRARDLEQSRTVLNAVIEQSPIPMIIAAPDGRIVTLNTALLEYAGEADRGGLRPGTRLWDTGVTWQIFDVDGEQVPLDEMPLRRTLEGVVTPGREMRFELADGTTKWAVQHATPIYDLNGKMIAGFSAFADITERKAAAEALRESEAKYRNLIQHSSEAIYLLYDRKFEIINRKFEQMFGVTLNDVNAPGFDFMDLVAPSSRPIVEDRMKRLGKGEQLEPTYDFTAVTVDGTEVSVEATVSYVKFRDGVATQGILRDVTERRRLEEQLNQAQRMDAVGRLAGGVAHDFNNLLTVIIGYSEVLLAQQLPNDASESIERILQAGERAKGLTSQLLAFSRKQIIQPKIIDVHTLIRELNKMLERLLGEDIAIVTKLNAEFDTVLVDPSQMEQVVLNIAVNARDAMPFGGTLTIETRNEAIESPVGSADTDSHTARDLHLTLKDTGVGMNEATRSRIFEPFFTTKGREKGTGLGLSTVYGIVMQNHGAIDVTSEPGQGSTFGISFPVADTPFKEADLTVTEIRDLSGTETILLVEDDSNVRAYMSSIISKQGYTVHTAENGKAALEQYADKVDTIDLVVGDVVMPVMSGPEFMNELLTRRPDLKCLYVSGYTDDAIVHHGVLDDGVELMQKPFSREALLSKVRAMLDSPHP